MPRMNTHPTSDPVTGTKSGPPTFPAYHFGRPVGLYHRRYRRPARAGDERRGFGQPPAGAVRPTVAT